jgi:hypothetical protein
MVQADKLRGHTGGAAQEELDVHGLQARAARSCASQCAGWRRSMAQAGDTSACGSERTVSEASTRSGMTSGWFSHMSVTLHTPHQPHPYPPGSQRRAATSGWLARHAHFTLSPRSAAAAWRTARASPAERGVSTRQHSAQPRAQLRPACLQGGGQGEGINARRDDALVDGGQASGAFDGTLDDCARARAQSPAVPRHRAAAARTVDGRGRFSGGHAAGARRQALAALAVHTHLITSSRCGRCARTRHAQAE